MSENEFTYWVFLGYSQQDNCEVRPDTPGVVHIRWADWLRAGLKAFSVPVEFARQINARGEIIPECLDAIFENPDGQSADSGLSEAARAALIQSKYLVVICSPRSAQSPQVNEAVRYFKQLGRGNRILPIVVAGEPNVADNGKLGAALMSECFVPAMRHPVLPDGTLDLSRREGGYIFADARGAGDRQEVLAAGLDAAEGELEKAKLQLIAGLIGVGYNGLLRREQQRRFSGFAEAQRAVQMARGKLIEAQQEAREAQRQVAEAQSQAQAAGGRLLEAQQRAGNIESQIAEARLQARETQNQLEAAWKQVREAQNNLLEMQHLPAEVKIQIQDAQNQLLEAQTQTRNTQSQLESARGQAREAQDKFIVLQRQLLQAQDQLQEFQNQSRQVQSQLEEARSQAQIAEIKLLEEQRQAREAQQQLQQAHKQAHEAQNKVREIQDQTRDVQVRILEAQNQAGDARAQMQAAQRQLQEVQNNARVAKRLMKVFALLAVIALLAAGTAANVARSQRNAARQALAQVALAEAQASAAPQDKTGEGIQPQVAANPPTIMTEEELGDLEIIFQTAAWEGWLRTDPEGALEWLGNLTGEELTEVLDVWGRSDLAAATGWVENLPDGDRKEMALLALVYAASERDPKAAAKYCVQLNTLQPEPEVVKSIAGALAKDDVSSAIEWAHSLKDDDSCLAALSALSEASSPTNSQPDSGWLTNSPAAVACEITNIFPSESGAGPTNAPMAE